ncbi:MAG: TAXI family TRAP transporter solute-binding subunit [Candidatus Caldarchaeales archaeon]
MSKSRIRILLVVAVVVVAAAITATYFTAVTRPPERVTFSIATGGVGGVYYPVGGAFASLWNKYLGPTVTATVEATTASVDNIKLLRDGKVEVAFTLPDTAYDAYRGAGAFSDSKVEVRTLAVLYNNYQHIVTLEGKGITKISDLKGKRVSTGAPGSGTEVIALRILRAAGIDPDKDIVRERLGVRESADALKDGKIDAFFWSGGIPTAAVAELASTPGLKVVLLPSSEVVEKLREQFGPIYFVAKIPAGTYAGQDRDIEVLTATNLLVVHARMPESLAYQLTKTLFDNIKEIEGAHAVIKDIKLEFQKSMYSPIPFHEGAIRYYREKGVWR